MRYFLPLALTALLLAASPQARANDGPSYTTLGARQTENGGHMNFRRITRENDLKPDDEANKTPPETQPAVDEVWAKYRALAAGTYEDKPPEPEKPKEDEQAKKEEPAPATGIAGILQEYRRNKEKRSQLRIISVKPPELPEKPVAPEAEEPAAGEAK